MKVLTFERKRRGWSQAKLAREAEMHPSQVCLIESGRLKPYPGQLAKLAAALGWPKEQADELLDEVGHDA